MKQFIAFIRKEFYHIFRDRRTVLILLGMPVVQILLFGFAINTEVHNAGMAVLDLSKDEMTRTITEHFRASEYFTIVEDATDMKQVDDAFRENRIVAAIVFGERFAGKMLDGEKAAVQIIADGTDPNQASIITGYASGVLSSFAAGQAATADVPFRIEPELRMLYNPQGKSAYNFVPGVMGLILMLICAMMTSISIVREKETGTMEVLLASPVKPIHIILAKAVPYFVLSVINLFTILLLSVFVLEVPVSGSLLLLTVISFLFIFLALSLGLLISTLVDSQMAAILLSGMGLMMPTMLLSGIIFPVENMPDILQWISAFVPVRWYIEAVKKIMIQGVEAVYVWKETLILLCMAAVLVALSLKKFKNRLS
ncbi:MAG TPA: ABC transporter permease [Candidatus Avibacteroides excrementipullorum]|jgi:ABC-2 type transport system permease protein|nr:ABC transporter permease [Candidatus Avibacteroides excrementipullorum]